MPIKVRALLRTKRGGNFRPRDLKVLKEAERKYPQAVMRAVYEEFTVPVFEMSQQNVPVWTADTHNSGSIRVNEENRSQRIVYTDPTALLIHEGKAGRNSDGVHTSGSRWFLLNAWLFYLNGLEARLAKTIRNIRRRKRIAPPEPRQAEQIPGRFRG